MVASYRSWISKDKDSEEADVGAPPKQHSRAVLVGINLPVATAFLD